MINYWANLQQKICVNVDYTGGNELPILLFSFNCLWVTSGYDFRNTCMKLASPHHHTVIKTS